MHKLYLYHKLHLLSLTKVWIDHYPTNITDGQYLQKAWMNEIEWNNFYLTLGMQIKFLTYIDGSILTWLNGDGALDPWSCFKFRSGICNKGSFKYSVIQRKGVRNLSFIQQYHGNPPPRKNNIAQYLDIKEIGPPKLYSEIFEQPPM